MLAPGASAPGIQLKGLDGHGWSLAEALRSGPVILAFFKISCPTCQLTFPFLQRLVDSGARLVAISQDDAASTREFHEQFGVSMPTLIDVARIWPASNAYQITSVPSLFLIEPDGTISIATEGFSRTAIEKLGERFHAVPFRETDRVPGLRPG